MPPHGSIAPRMHGPSGEVFSRVHPPVPVHAMPHVLHQTARLRCPGRSSFRRPPPPHTHPFQLLVSAWAAGFAHGPGLAYSAGCCCKMHNALCMLEAGLVACCFTRPSGTCVLLGVGPAQGFSAALSTAASAAAPAVLLRASVAVAWGGGWQRRRERRGRWAWECALQRGDDPVCAVLFAIRFCSVCMNRMHLRGATVTAKAGLHRIWAVARFISHARRVARGDKERASAELPLRNNRQRRLPVSGTLLWFAVTSLNRAPACSSSGDSS